MNTGYANPTSEQLLVCAHSPHADLLVDDVHPPQTEQKHMQRSHMRSQEQLTVIMSVLSVTTASTGNSL